MNRGEKIVLVKEDPFFISPQGEGSRTGRLSSWLRSSTCNLKCAWKNEDGSVTLCDTAYSSHKPTKNIVTVGEAFDRLINNNCSDVVLTGGEPTVQKGIRSLVNPLEKAGKRVTVETNGTLFFESNATLISMSPKLIGSSRGLEEIFVNAKNTFDTDNFLNYPRYPAEAAVPDEQQKEIDIVVKKYQGFLGLHEKNRYNLESFQKYIEFYKEDRYQFKFVVNSDEDIQEVTTKFVEPLKIPNNNIWLMPQGVTHEQLQLNAEKVVNYCKELGCHYSDRVHVRIWGNKVGV